MSVYPPLSYWMGAGLLRSTLRYWHVSRLGPHELHPGADSWEAGEIEAPFAGDVGVGVECDVGDRVAVRGEEVVLAQVFLHHLEGCVAEPPLLLQHLRPLLGHLHAEVDPGARHGDVGFVAVLLEEHPPQDPRLLEPPAREVGRALREENRIAPDSGRHSPSSVSSTGTRPLEFMFWRNSGVRVSPFARSYSTRSKGRPSCVRRSLTL